MRICLCFFKIGHAAINFAEQSHNQNCVDMLREMRPVKQNPSNLPRVKRSLSSNERSEGGGGVTSDSNNRNKFEKMFTGTTAASKYMNHDEDTSELVTEDNHKLHPPSNGHHNRDRSDKNTWNDDDDDDDSDADSRDSLSATEDLRKNVNV